MTEEFISRTEALKDFEECNNANQNWTPQRVKTLLFVSALPTLLQWCMGNGSKMNGSLLTFRRCTTAASVISQSSRSTLRFRNAVNTVGR